MPLTKTCYWTEQTIAAQAAGILRRFQPSGSVPRITYDPPRSALLILDMQQYFLDPGSPAFIPAAPAIVPALAELAGHYLCRQLPVILTRHHNTPADARMMGQWWSRLLTPDNPAAALTPTFQALIDRGACLIAKTQYDAFHNTELQEILQTRGVRQLVIAGVMANVCVDTTARAAFVREFQVILPIDAGAAYTRQLHLASLRNLAFAVGPLATVAQLRRQLTTSHAASVETKESALARS